ncbi:hypothetical protein KY290_026629 [Solanum tuberosum]|uniref:DUF4283 domain-containing protein n=1 Tax=Solanum tuberosum TaxID=4113 RepID=A0ABQ7UWZ6_SOLTU|nr:hypothetical protein KY284_023664 [Solanum tuberosum]KAH0756359.1 hypothetical protein KY290_026629 [Solanum tuberosum]
MSKIPTIQTNLNCPLLNLTGNSPGTIPPLFEVPVHGSYANAAVNRSIGQNRVQLAPRSYELQDGKQVVFFSVQENELLAQKCKWTIIDDHINVYSTSFLTIGENHIMKILRWTTDFKPEEEITLAPVWINLPWHYYEWDAICRKCKPIGTPLVMDKATNSKTRPATAKVRIEIDLTRPLINEILVEIRNNEGKVMIINQKVEYETIPAFCFHCKIQGHKDEKCRKLQPELRSEHVNEGEKNGQNIHQDNRQLEHQQRQGFRKEKVVITKPTEQYKQNLSNPQMVHNHSVQTDEWKTIRRRGKPVNNTTIEESS